MQSFAALILRSFVYMLVVIGTALLFTYEGFSLQTASTYSETSITERLHDLYAFLSCLLFLSVAYINQQYRPAAILVAALMGMLFIRELDAVLDEQVFDGAWQTIVCIIIAATAFYLYRLQLPIKQSLLDYARTNSAGIFFSGLMVLIVFSRLIGRGAFWQAVMGENYIRVVKNIAEEGTEVMGYMLLLIAALEMLWLVIAKKRAEASA